MRGDVADLYLGLVSVIGRLNVPQIQFVEPVAAGSQVTKRADKSQAEGQGGESLLAGCYGARAVSTLRDSRFSAAAARSKRASAAANVMSSPNAALRLTAEAR